MATVDVPNGHPVKCQGVCVVHLLPVRRFKVIDGDTGKDWGIFDYCPTAVHIDTEAGFILTEVEDGN